MLIKKIIFTYSIFLFTTACFSQSNKFEFGLSSGISLGKLNNPLNNSLSLGSGTITSYTINTILKLNLDKDWSLKSGLNFTKTGGVYSGIQFTDYMGNYLGPSDAFEKLDYLSIPITTEYVTGKKVKFKFNSGFSIGYLLASTSKIVFKNPLPTNTNLQTESAIDSYKKINLSLVLGTGIQTALKKNLYWNLDLALHTGILNILKSQESQPPTVTLNSILITTGISIPLK